MITMTPPVNHSSGAIRMGRQKRFLTGLDMSIGAMRGRMKIVNVGRPRHRPPEIVLGPALVGLLAQPIVAMIRLARLCAVARPYP